VISISKSTYVIVILIDRVRHKTIIMINLVLKFNNIISQI